MEEHSGHWLNAKRALHLFRYWRHPLQEKKNNIAKFMGELICIWMWNIVLTPRRLHLTWGSMIRGYQWMGVGSGPNGCNLELDSNISWIYMKEVFDYIPRMSST